MYRNGFTLAIFCDISGAFDNINIKAILDGLKRKNIPEFITGWFESCLRNRMAESILDDGKVKRLLTKGTAQGGVLSTIAWNIAIDDILEELTSVLGFGWLFPDWQHMLGIVYTAPSTLLFTLRP